MDYNYKYTEVVLIHASLSEFFPIIVVKVLLNFATLGIWYCLRESYKHFYYEPFIICMYCYDYSYFDRLVCSLVVEKLISCYVPYKGNYIECFIKIALWI